MKVNYWVAIGVAVLMIWPMWAGTMQLTSCAKWRHYSAIKEEIRGELEAPRAAEFAPATKVEWGQRADFIDERDGSSACMYEAEGYVDAYNRHGVPMRKDFSALTVGARAGVEVVYAVITSR